MTFRLAILALLLLAVAFSWTKRVAADVPHQVELEINTLGLKCDGDSVPAVVRVSDGARPVPLHPVRIGFATTNGEIFDPATGARGEYLEGVTDAGGEWHLVVTPEAGTTTRFTMMLNSRGPLQFACPFPDDDSYSLRLEVFWDHDADGAQGHREKKATGVILGLGANGCCNWSTQYPLHWHVVKRNGRTGWNGLWAGGTFHTWELCVPPGSRYRIVSVNGVASDGHSFPGPYEHCYSVPNLVEGVNRALVGVSIAD